MLWQCNISEARCNIYTLEILFSLLSFYHFKTERTLRKKNTHAHNVNDCAFCDKRRGSMVNCCLFLCHFHCNLRTILLSNCVLCYCVCDLIQFSALWLLTGCTVTGITDTPFFVIYSILSYFFSSLVSSHFKSMSMNCACEERSM